MQYLKQLNNENKHQNQGSPFYQLNDWWSVLPFRLWLYTKFSWAWVDETCSGLPWYDESCTRSIGSFARAFAKLGGFLGSRFLLSVLHVTQGRKLGFGGQQFPSLFHSRWNQVSRHGSCIEAKPKESLPRRLAHCRFLLSSPRIHAHGTA